MRLPHKLFEHIASNSTDAGYRRFILEFNNQQSALAICHGEEY